MTFADYVSLFRRGWLFLVATTLVGLVLASLFTATRTPTYSAGATVVISSPADQSGSDLAQGDSFAVQRAVTYAGLATTTQVLAVAARQTGDAVGTLRASVGASARVGTALLDVSATGSSGQQAAGRANAVAAALITQAPVVDGAGVGTGVLALKVATTAETPSAPVTPRPFNNLLIGAVVGLALAIGVLVAGQALDTRIRGIGDVPSGNRLPVGTRLVTVTSLPEAGPRRTRSSGLSGSAASRLEAFRHLRANLQFNAAARGTIAVAGVTADADAHGVADQFASVLGETELTVAVVDVDLRPHLDRRRRQLDAGVQPGVAEVLGGTAVLDEVVRRGVREGVWVVGPGAVKESSAQQLSTAPMRDLLDGLVARFDYVLLVCPPLALRAEAAVVAALSQSSLVVVEAGSTTRADFLYAVDLLAGVGVTAFSVALDRVRSLDLGRTRLRVGPSAPDPA